jgi:lysophospholipase L1-like esterase
MRWLSLSLFVGLTALALGAEPAKPSEPKLPLVVLIGDSIRLGYTPTVKAALAGVAEVVSVQENGFDSANVRKRLDDWVIQHQPAVVHFNCGLHDLKKLATGTQQVPLADYTANLQHIVQRLQKETTARLIFASTTPIDDARHAQRKANFSRINGDVQAYNTAALTVMHAAQVPVNDLYTHLTLQPNWGTFMVADGTHYMPAGSQLLGQAVADCIRRQLALSKVVPLPTQPSGPAATEKHLANLKAARAQVPPGYRTPTIPAFTPPTSAEAWTTQRPALHSKVLATLGDFPARPTGGGTRISLERRAGYTLEKWRLPTNLDAAQMSVLLCIPTAPAGKVVPYPAVLLLHSSSYDSQQFLARDMNGGPEPLAEVLVQAGYVVCAPDAAWYGDRSGAGPTGPSETTLRQQESLHKQHQMFGRTLWGTFVRDDQIALDFLSARPEVDAKRIGATGMSMGSTRAWWLAALDERISACVGVACLTRYE